MTCRTLYWRSSSCSARDLSRSSPGRRTWLDVLARPRLEDLPVWLRARRIDSRTSVVRTIIIVSCHLNAACCSFGQVRDCTKEFILVLISLAVFPDARHRRRLLFLPSRPSRSPSTRRVVATVDTDVNNQTSVTLFSSPQIIVEIEIIGCGRLSQTALPFLRAFDLRIESAKVIVDIALMSTLRPGLIHAFP